MGQPTRPIQPSILVGSVKEYNSHIHLYYGAGDHLNSRLGLCAAVAQVKVRVCGFGLLSPKLNAGPVCEDSTTEGGMHKCGAYMSES